MPSYGNAAVCAGLRRSAQVRALPRCLGTLWDIPDVLECAPGEFRQVVPCWRRSRLVKRHTHVLFTSIWLRSAKSMAYEFTAAHAASWRLRNNLLHEELFQCRHPKLRPWGKRRGLGWASRFRVAARSTLLRLTAIWAALVEF